MKTRIFLLYILLMSLDAFTQPAFLTPYENQLGTTWYDLQTERTMQNRLFVFDDGSAGAVWNMGMNYPAFSDLGVGYTYFDGANWGPPPYQSITSGWAIYPSYTNFGENGEICVSQGQNGLFINWRSNKGTGSWQEALFAGASLKHPLVVTSGADDHIVHILYLKADETFTSTNAQTYRGFLWYARSSDGMISWEIDQQIMELSSDDYLGFTIGSYSWAEPKDNVIAFVVGDYLTDLLMLKSDDGGDTWQKSLIWEHPYPMFEIFTFESDSFYCNGGSMSITLDNTDMAHVAFGLSRVYSTTEQDTLWYDPYADGIVYWREDMPAFKNTLNSLHPDSLSICENLIGWSFDVNGNGSNDILPPSKYPMLGLSSMPQLKISDFGQIHLVFSSVTEMYNNGVENYRHLWMTSGIVDQCFWNNQFTDLNSDLIHIFDECVFPSLASSIDDNLYLTYQYDAQPGPAINEDSLFTENKIGFMQVPLFGEQKSEKGIYVNFKYNQDSIFEGDTVHFQNLSCGCPYPISSAWYFEGGNPTASNDQHPNVIYNIPGTYDVQLNSGNGLTNGIELKEDYISVYPITSIEVNSNGNEIVILPNPTSGEFNIFGLDHFEHGQIHILNVLGHEVFRAEITNSKTKTLKLNHIPDGLYFVLIKSKEITEIKKVILRR